ncbi:hypothetical protein TNCV_4995301 [Trichonephila clavipes]|nr:hypothetical protein TNCV_4995301 [Trichonephila clavipes]
MAIRREVAGQWVELQGLDLGFSEDRISYWLLESEDNGSKMASQGGEMNEKANSEHDDITTHFGNWNLDRFLHPISGSEGTLRCFSWFGWMKRCGQYVKDQWRV